jgi:hypothetical protein
MRAHFLLQVSSDYLVWFTSSVSIYKASSVCYQKVLSAVMEQYQL